MQINNTLSKHQLVPLYFHQDAIANAQTAVALYTVQVHGAVANTTIGYVMPFKGEVIGVSVGLDLAGSAGTVTVVPTIDTVACTDPSAAMTTTAVAASDTCKRGTNAFAKDALIGANLTTAGWDGITADLSAVVWVLLNISGI
jgi:hypothetical protein